MTDMGNKEKRGNKKGHIKYVLIDFSIVPVFQFVFSEILLNCSLNFVKILS